MINIKKDSSLLITIIPPYFQIKATLHKKYYYKTKKNYEVII